jgi:hypothetical protein
MFELGVMPQIKALKLLPYQNYIVAIISVRRRWQFCFGRAALQHSFIAFSALAKELGVVIIVPFRKRMAGVYHNSAYIIDTDGSEGFMPSGWSSFLWEKFYFTPEI